MTDEEKHKKFDVVIGNPPYQDETAGTRSSQKSIYHLFMDQSFKIGDLVELITPARFLYDAGDTPSKFNQKILNSPHFKLLYLALNGKDVFPNTAIEGGIITWIFGDSVTANPIHVFIPYPQLKSIYNKVLPDINKNGNLIKIIYPANKFNLERLYKAFPNAKSQISSHGRERRLQSNIFKLDTFHDSPNPNDFAIYGVVNKKRKIKYIQRDFIDTDFTNDIFKYKVVLPKSHGPGDFGMPIGTPELAGPNSGYTYTFIGIGAFDTKVEAVALAKYIKGKFARAMLGILKVTQDNTPQKWRYVPIQDFTDKSDIDWTKSISEIDQQLYEKYNLSQDEIDFIESHVKEMD